MTRSPGSAAASRLGRSGCITLLVLFALVAAHHVAQTVVDFYGGRSFLTDLSSWTTSDYVIDYSAGFVRRGLTGWFFELVGITSVAPWLLWVGLTLSVLIDAVVIVRLVRTGNRNPLVWAVVLFSPNLIFFRINDPDAMFRKELFFVVIILLQLLALRLTPLRYARSQWVIIGVLGTIATLTHESFVFLGLPVLLLISALKIIADDSADARRLRAWTLLPACIPFVVAILCFTHLGDSDIAQRICDSEHRHFGSQMPCDQLAGALYAMADRNVYLTEAREMYKRRYVFLHWAFLFTSFFALVGTATLTCAVHLARSVRAQSFNESRFVTCALLAVVMIFAFAAPLYVIAIDWGRWFCFSSLTVLICLTDRRFIAALTQITVANDRLIPESSPISISPVVQALIGPIVILQLGLFSIPRCCLSTEVRPSYATFGKISHIRDPIRALLAR